MKVTHTSTELHSAWPDPSVSPDGDAWNGVQIGGRLLFRNRMGKAMFLRIQDRGEATAHGVDSEGTAVTRGGIIQVYLRRDEVGDETFATLKKLDIGDMVWARGNLMRTRTGELTVHATEVRLAGKILTPFPDRQHGIADIQTRSRQRYVDLFMNETTRQTFRTRSRMVTLIRRFFDEREYIEVETPMMHPIPGGAAARPFVTHHNTLHLDLYLRVAPELYLKRLVVGGLERVYEINRNFRNEGVSTKHNPEFTMLEFYQAWATHDDVMAMTEELISGLATTLCGGTDVTFGEQTLDFSMPFRRAPMDQLIAEATGLTVEQLGAPEAMAAYWTEQHGPLSEAKTPETRGKWWELLFDKYVEPNITDPTFVTDFPTEISPLSRRSDDRPDRVDRFELFVAGFELANGFSELNDPIDQLQRFQDQATGKGDPQDASKYVDHDYIRALSYAMPPTAGEGIGIDRLAMLLTNSSSIREVILFPTLRPDGK
jgi:lysyl-tRNA synthetase class 2